MHGRVGAAVESREIDRVNLAAIVPLVAVVIALGLYPQFVVHRTEKDTTNAIQRPAAIAAGGAQEVSEAR